MLLSQYLLLNVTVAVSDVALSTAVRIVVRIGIGVLVLVLSRNLNRNTAVVKQIQLLGSQPSHYPSATSSSVVMASLPFRISSAYAGICSVMAEPMNQNQEIPSIDRNTLFFSLA